MEQFTKEQRADAQKYNITITDKMTKVELNKAIAKAKANDTISKTSPKIVADTSSKLTTIDWNNIHKVFNQDISFEDKIKLLNKGITSVKNILSVLESYRIEMGKEPDDKLGSSKNYNLFKVLNAICDEATYAVFSGKWKLVDQYTRMYNDGVYSEWNMHKYSWLKGNEAQFETFKIFIILLNNNDGSYKINANTLREAKTVLSENAISNLSRYYTK